MAEGGAIVYDTDTAGKYKPPIPWQAAMHIIDTKVSRSTLELQYLHAMRQQSLSKINEELGEILQKVEELRVQYDGKVVNHALTVQELEQLEHAIHNRVNGSLGN